MTKELEKRITELEAEVRKYQEYARLKASQEGMTADILNRLMATHDKRMAAVMEALKAYHRGYITGEGRSMREAHELTEKILKEGWTE